MRLKELYVIREGLTLKPSEAIGRLPHPLITLSCVEEFGRLTGDGIGIDGLPEMITKLVMSAKDGKISDTNKFAVISESLLDIYRQLENARADSQMFSDEPLSDDFVQYIEDVLDDLKGRGLQTDDSSAILGFENEEFETPSRWIDLALYLIDVATEAVDTRSSYNSPVVRALGILGKYSSPLLPRPKQMSDKFEWEKPEQAKYLPAGWLKCGDFFVEIQNKLPKRAVIISEVGADKDAPEAVRVAADFALNQQ